LPARLMAFCFSIFELSHSGWLLFHQGKRMGEIFI